MHYTEDDFSHSPLMFYYEVTQACDLICKHCRASAQANADPLELDHELSRALIDQVTTFPHTPIMVMTGGDPLKRADLFDLIRYATSKGLQLALTPSATPLATREAFERARDAGIQRLGISLDGVDAKTHDAFRGWEGSFERTLIMLNNARELGMAVQVNTTITRRNFRQLDAMAALLASQGIAMWATFFLIPVGRGVEEQRLDAQEMEEAFAKLWHHAQTQPYSVKTTEAPHYRRFVMQQGGDPLAGPHGRADDGRHRGHRAPLGVGDGKGVMFVSHRGEIYPSGFMPLLCGRFPDVSVVDTYQNHATFRALRDPDRFHGKCGICEFRRPCGGSRARAYAVFGDPLASEPDCVFEPEGVIEATVAPQ
ncbi:MAG: TIGR04053 family radical SAM/SPASM domain-containing protein [Pirellulaceae bacterium]